MFNRDGSLKIRSTRESLRPPRQRREEPTWSSFSMPLVGEFANGNPHVRAPLKSFNKLDWRPKVGERTSHEYGSFFVQKKAVDGALRESMPALPRSLAVSASVQCSVTWMLPGSGSGQRWRRGTQSFRRADLGVV
jgi:hypothetical protein